MILLHTSDWHLGKRLEDFSRIDEQKAVLHEICEIVDKENANVIIISGDLFDTYNPPTEAIELFYKILKKLSNNGRRAVIAIAGNHDSPDRIESPDPLARECGIIFIGFPNTIVPEFELETGLKVLKSDEGFVELQLPNVAEPFRIIHTAYANEFRLKTYLGSENQEEQMRDVLSKKWQQLSEKYCDKNGVNILMGHLFVIKEGGVIPEEPEDEKPILHVGGAQAIFTTNIPDTIQYAAIGHLHRKQKVDDETCPVFYSGSPLSYSFAEANQKKYVLLAQIEPQQKASIKEIELTKGKKLLRYKAENIEEAIKWLTENKDCLVELTLISDTYLTAKNRKQLNNIHDGIVNIIPEVRNKEMLSSTRQIIDLTKKTGDLFREYFIHEKGQEPNARIMDLFKEVLSEEEAE